MQKALKHTEMRKMCRFYAILGKTRMPGAHSATWQVNAIVILWTGVTLGRLQINSTSFHLKYSSLFPDNKVFSKCKAPWTV